MTLETLKAILETLIYTADEPLTRKQLGELLPEASPDAIEVALAALVADYANRGLVLREIAGGWQIATRPELSEYVRRYHRSRPSARLSLAALETLAVIAYKQPVTVPEILEIRGVSSSSAIKTLLDRKLITPKGRKECVGRPILYGTSKEFLLQFGLRDLSVLPSLEDLSELDAPAS
ncbi:MAG: SMC-Scp complex subunit ScpB [Chloracidobacterium sp.]|uniref:SMC-Scp complex subunit ScpB n=1 Tax=Chloracidobacterium validum TaxID=2821543 RepID=A0ABX8BGB8_9BACT|nr:SMC-Scp complex subunit ScpB [Chloracidobacterium validum]QUW04550.1 SMC-Scp complex subunit ScpB [Chloracidobacterium validum]